MFSGPSIERTETFDAATADVWSALRDAPETLGFGVPEIDEGERSVRVRVRPDLWTLTTLGQELTASVTARGDTTDLRLQGMPRVWSFTARRRIEQLHEAIVESIRGRLARQAMT